MYLLGVCRVTATITLLISVTVSGQTTTFVYDGDGNLVKKIKPDGSNHLRGWNL